jgi:hypothetical protein
MSRRFKWWTHAQILSILLFFINSFMFEYEVFACQCWTQFQTSSLRKYFQTRGLRHYVFFRISAVSFLYLFNLLHFKAVLLITSDLFKNWQCIGFLFIL